MPLQVEARRFESDGSFYNETNNVLGNQVGSENDLHNHTKVNCNETNNMIQLSKN